MLGQRWSPPQIARHLRARFPEQPSMRLCHESIYQTIYQPGSTFVRPPTVPLVPSEHRSPLRTGRDHRRAQQRIDRLRPRFAEPMLTIHQRPFEANDRSEPGHWEGDLIVGRDHVGRDHVGRDHGSAIGTLVERSTRMIRLLHLPRPDANTLHRTLTARMNDLPPSLLRSITWDQGTEMARHVETAAGLGGVPIYFCDPHSPWQRGSNENANGLLRQYFPKRTDLTVHRPEHLLAVEHEINTRPRLVLADRDPADLFTALLASTDQPTLRR